jgi:parallel beta-helix repeat protein
MKTLKTCTYFASTVIALLACGGRARGTDISGNISSTLMIVDDSRLVGDVTCTTALLTAPCIVLGADNITLRLDGHTITGPVVPPVGCSVPTDSAFGVGILVNGEHDVNIQGPGVIQYFERWGIFLSSSTRVVVKRVTANRNCWSGMQLIATSDSTFEDDVSANNAAGSNGAGCGGICVDDSNNNLIHKCAFYGNGSLDYAVGNVDFGIGLAGSSSGNQVETNDIAGNTNGVLFFNTASDNIISNNIVAGNPPAQLLKAFALPNQQGADIAFRANFTGVSNSFNNNFCLTSIGPATAPCPNVHPHKGHETDGGSHEEDVQ